MSYSFDITAEPIPEDESKAWEEVEKLRAREDSLSRDRDSPGEQFLPLYQKLTARYPCIMTDEGEDSPWADGPLLRNFGKLHTILAISYSRVADALPVIIEIATEMGFTLFDPQDEKIYRPMKPKPASPPAASTGQPKKPWWKLW
jgi:hypothetical protein